MEEPNGWNGGDTWKKMLLGAWLESAFGKRHLCQGRDISEDEFSLWETSAGAVKSLKRLHIMDNTQEQRHP